ncbi:RBBP9/YdeN family alpha/beta hydrolase [Pseudochryseolinea flava]|uniref:Serine hydrolase family protein n=1 Tax=Pseudochryseolinea flava TaxID=2059302 RepID=A0A364Y7M6_9BACT|nr:alpha/beta fold hydrolase [Pseudochryseolinea flava]RAW02950.1 serine hydrolase family protein [Pseudochryseolinea flava]
MTTTILFIHSAGTQAPNQGSYDLVGWLRKVLDPSYRIVFPLMHDPETPEYSAWRDQIERELALIDETVIMIGHSLGGSVALKYLSEERIQNNIAALFLIAAPFWGFDEEWNVGDFLLEKGFEEKIGNVKTTIYHSVDDPWVPSEHATFYGERLHHARVKLIEGDDHEFRNGLQQLANDILKTQS